MGETSKTLSLSPREAAIEAAIIAARIDLLAFVRLTKQDYIVAPHHEVIADHLMAVARGEIKRLMLFLPPRHGKSQLSSRHFPAWYLGRFPDKQIILASYNTKLATQFGRDVRNLVAEPLYQSIFPGTALKQDSKAADCWFTQSGGVFLSAGIGGGITGWGADLALIDDPFKDPDEAHSATIKDNVWEWYKQALYTRLMPGGAIIMTLTRWAEDDLAGRALESAKTTDEKWTIVKLPALADYDDPLGRSRGEALWDDRYPLRTLETIRKTLGEYAWSALYQQNPFTEEGAIFQRSWWQYYSDHPPWKTVIQSWDTAFKDGQANDYSVCTTWGIVPPNIYLIDRFKAKLQFPELKRMAVMLSQKYCPHAVLIEDLASGQSLVQELKRDSQMTIIPIKQDRNKEARAHAVTPLIQGARVYLPEWASWVEDYVNELAKFPHGDHDDDVDSTTMALEYLKPQTLPEHRMRSAGPRVMASYDWNPLA